MGLFGKLLGSAPFRGTSAQFGASISALTSKTNPVNADNFVIADSEAGGAGKKLSFANLKTALKTYFDTFYFPSLSVLRSYLAATVTFNDDDTLGDTALSVGVAADGIYTIEAVLFTDSATRDIQLDFAGTATVANFIGQYEQRKAEDGAVIALTVARSVSAATAFVGNNEAFNSIVVFKGTVEITNAGTFLIRAAQAVAHASDTSILRGSYLVLTKTN